MKNVEMEDDEFEFLSFILFNQSLNIPIIMSQPAGRLQARVAVIREASRRRDAVESIGG